MLVEQRIFVFKLTVEGFAQQNYNGVDGQC